MQFHNLKRNKNNRKAKQVGRGGSRGKTSGRGTKGQNARSGRKKRPEMRDIIKRMPKLRGRGKNSLKSRLFDFVAINLNDIENKFNAGEVVDSNSLHQRGLLSKRNGRIKTPKILGGGNLTKSLIFRKIKISEKAKVLIEKTKSKIENE